MVRIDILTIFPGMFSGPFSESILMRAQESGALQIEVHNIRDFALDKHKTTDDYPFGGGPGMVMKPEPVFLAVEHVKELARQRGVQPWVILMCPQGRRLDQALVERLAKLEHIIIICGHYEGVDERIRQYLVDEEISIGDYILTGGELPAMVLTDAVARLLPGVISEESTLQESFRDGFLEYPQYTRPQDFRGMKVPEVLLSGDHEKVRLWRRKESLRRTLMRRPDLLESRDLSPGDLALLKEIEREMLGG
ncbi:MAG TPA: tRNA (guanosine(37)-N1)-methyltransferase TrmD [Firmicutes bacterium]|nr:tRNA (guanosine(37)-N1)-methyltransferase TrmD [Bacillota bacterium]